MRGSTELGVLDFCHVSEGAEPEESLWDTLELVRVTEELGYSRYWLSEHHGSQVAHATPDVLLPALAGTTDTIRVGAAGMLLRFYSPLRVANAFRLLHTLFPDRIDLGLARARTHPRVERLLLEGREERPYSQKVEELLGYLRGVGDVAAIPLGIAPPDVWMLGSGVESMSLAARLGTAFCLAVFLKTRLRDVRQIVEEYRERFQPGPELTEPKVGIAFAGACTETEEEAHRAAESIEYNVRPSILGTPAQCRDGVERLCGDLDIDLLVFADIHTELMQRRRSYDLMAAALEVRSVTVGDPRG